MHLTPVGALHQRVPENGLERRAFLEYGAHRQDGVEPVAELAREALGNEVKREPFLPVVVVGEVVRGRERDDAGVEPGVAYVLNARDRLAAFPALDLDFVHPGPVRRVPVEVFPAGHGPGLQFLP